MISAYSILRRIPPDFNQREALFLDGIRHAAEIAELAFGRLQTTLTDLALNQEPGVSNAPRITAAYLDAWAFVDAADRIRSLFALMPGVPGEERERVKVETKSIRDLRNVADHLAQRADYVLANNGTALGSLSWFTYVAGPEHSGILCLIRPGTVRQTAVKMTAPPYEAKPAGTSSAIELAAGEYKASLSEAHARMSACITKLEVEVEMRVAAAGLIDQQAGADLFLSAALPRASSGDAAPAEGA